MNSLSKEKRKFILVSLAVPVALIIMFIVYPLGSLIKMSFTDFDGLNPNYSFVGLDNFKTVLFDSPDLWKSLLNNLKYLIVSTVAIPFELALAAMFITKFRGVKFFRSVVLLPYVINSVAVATTFAYFLSPINGGFNSILTAFGMESFIHSWLSDPHVVSWVLPLVSLWCWCGYHIILFIAALRSIDKEMLEAARMDGANAFQIFWNIQIPNIQAIISFTLFTNIAGSFKQFALPFVMTSGGPGYASSTFTLYTITTAFTYQHFGLASAMAIVMILMVLLIQFVQQKIMGNAKKG